MNKILLSWSTLSGTEKYPCYYFNSKIMNIPQPTNEWMEKGKKAHEEFSKLKKLPFDLDFPEKEIHCQKDYGKYILHGYADRVNYKSKSILELKTVNKKLWTNQDVDKTLQPVYYSWIFQFPKVFLLTCKFDLSEPKLFYREYTPKDWIRVEEWVKKIIKIIETTNWKTYKCDGSCQYADQCYFAKNS